LLLAACSGGADSLALAAALAWEAPRAGLRAGGITVDHGLQPGSAAQAERVCRVLAKLRLDPADSARAAVPGRQASGYPGPEAAARAARYAALEAAASRHGAAAILLGHTMDDQAETVLLGLARGSGARSLAGMPAASGPYLRPLLGVRREVARQACAALGLEPWADPHNGDAAFARVRVRTAILPLMEELIGPGITEALARTADQLRADADALDRLADGTALSLALAGQLAAGGAELDAVALAALPAAIRARLLKASALSAGCPPGALSARHLRAMEALVTGWRGQHAADLPGGVRCERRYDKLSFAGPAAATGTEGTGGRLGHGRRPAAGADRAGAAAGPDR
jgi:tRNA(Ile)-lysidine synthase